MYEPDSFVFRCLLAQAIALVATIQLLCGPNKERLQRDGVTNKFAPPKIVISLFDHIFATEKADHVVISIYDALFQTKGLICVIWSHKRMIFL